MLFVVKSCYISLFRPEHDNSNRAGSIAAMEGDDYCFWPNLPEAGFPHPADSYFPFGYMEMVPPPPQVRLPRVMRKFLKGPPVPRAYKPRVYKKYFPVMTEPNDCFDWGQDVLPEYAQGDMLGPLPTPHDVAPIGLLTSQKNNPNRLRVGKSFQCPLPTLVADRSLGEKVLYLFPRGPKEKLRRVLKELEEVQIERPGEVQASPAVVSLVEPEEIEICEEADFESVQEETAETSEEVLEIQGFIGKRRYNKKGKRKSKRDMGARGSGDMRFFHRYEEIMGNNSVFSVN